MPHIALTGLGIRKAKPQEKPYRLYDSLGLFVLVNPNGSMLWRQKQEHQGKERLLTYGTCPLVSLAYARRKRDEVRGQMAEGVDPSVQRR